MKKMQIKGNIISKKLEKNISLVIIDRKIIIPYSPKNNNANFHLPYSVLKPLTSSDSPSAKSKGARFVSIKQLISHLNHKKVAHHRMIGYLLNLSKSNLIILIIRQINKIPNVIS